MYLKSEKGITLFMLVFSIVCMFINVGVISTANMNNHNQELLDRVEDAEDKVEEANKNEKLSLLGSKIQMEVITLYAEGEEFDSEILERIENLEVLRDNIVDDGYITCVKYEDYYIKILFNKERQISSMEYIDESEVFEQ